MSEPLRVVIIGNGIAGVTVAAKLRGLQPDPSRLDVRIYAREPFAYYSRIRLPEVFASRLGPEDLAVYKPEWYVQRSIQVCAGDEIVRIDPAARRLFTRSGGEAAYDELVLCMGADCFKPPIANIGLDGIFTIREYGDADAVRSHVINGARQSTEADTARPGGARQAVVVGGGLLGLEAAHHLRAPGQEGGQTLRAPGAPGQESGQTPGVESVTIIEIAPRLLPRQLDETGSGLLRRIIEAQGCSVILGAQVAEFLGEGTVSGLRLADGRRIPAQTVLISAGIVPRTALAREAGCVVRRGVVVDEHLRTSLPHVWAAGDLAEFQGVVWGIIPAAVEHASVVAAGILGDDTVIYTQTIPQNTLKVAGVNLTSIGKVFFEPGEEARYQVIEKVDEAGLRYEKYVLQNGELAGCILLGSRANYGFATKHIGQPVRREEILTRLW
jgi:NAD(P)H-nitrite reductase large subunit